jgi:hypothetical protein
MGIVIFPERVNPLDRKKSPVIQEGPGSSPVRRLLVASDYGTSTTLPDDEIKYLYLVHTITMPIGIKQLSADLLVEAFPCRASSLATLASFLLDCWFFLLLLQERHGNVNVCDTTTPAG